MHWEGDFTSTPILITSVTGYPQAYDYYTIEVDSIKLDHETLPGGNGKTWKYIVDSGTTQNFVPTSIATAINNAFSPAAVYNQQLESYIVDCNATAPRLGFNIAGTVFDINPLDMIILDGTDAQNNDVCVTSVTIGGDADTGGFYVLGDAFLKNVVSVFDIGATEMRFAAREFYPSNDPY